MIRRGVLLGLLVCAMPPIGFVMAVDVPSSQDQFDALVREIGALRSDLDKLDRNERSIVNELDRLAVESELQARELQRLEALEAKARRELERTRQQLVPLRQAVQREETGLARQLRTAYEMGRSSELKLFLSLSEPVDVMRVIAYIDVMAERQSGVVVSLRQRRGEAEALERALAVQTASLEDLSAQEKSRAGQLAQVRRKSAELLLTTRQERDAHRSAILELTRAATDLESAIVSNTEAGDSAGAPALRAGPPSIDIEKLRGAMEWPVPGEIAVGFGDIRDRKFGTLTPHPGLDIRTEPNTPIRAVLAGRVVFSRRFSGYGNTILLDHGGHYLSVYARAAVVNVKEGDLVVPGQVLGYSAEQAFDNGPPTVYFEMRRDGRAVDPAQWLMRKAASRREEER